MSGRRQALPAGTAAAKKTSTLATPASARDTAAAGASGGDGRERPPPPTCRHQLEAAAATANLKPTAAGSGGEVGSAAPGMAAAKEGPADGAATKANLKLAAAVAGGEVCICSAFCRRRRFPRAIYTQYILILTVHTNTYCEHTSIHTNPYTNTYICKLSCLKYVITGNNGINGLGRFAYIEA